MAFPPLVRYPTSQEYREHYERCYCRGERCVTPDGIRVYFRKQRFNHAFYESDKSTGKKSDALNSERAERIDWIRATLESSASELYQGWITEKKQLDATRRVAVVQANYVVVVQLALDKNGALMGNFVTAIVMDGAGIAKVRSDPKWTREDCLKALGP